MLLLSLDVTKFLFVKDIGENFKGFRFDHFFWDFADHFIL